MSVPLCSLDSLDTAACHAFVARSWKHSAPGRFTLSVGLEWPFSVLVIALMLSR